MSQTVSCVEFLENANISIFLTKERTYSDPQHPPALFGVHTRKLSRGNRVATQRSVLNAGMIQMDAFTNVTCIGQMAWHTSVLVSPNHQPQAYPG